MESYISVRHPSNDRELEDGEICDDETEVRAPPRRREARRPVRGYPPLASLLGLPPPDFHHLMPYGLGPHGPYPPGGPDRPPPPSEPPPGLGPHGELPSPRSNFWERSHGALGRFKHRGLPNRGRGAWSWGRGRAPPSRYGPADSHGSPPRKQKPVVRIRPRKPTPAELGVNESFEDLLFKYKQIQLELECIRQEESRALTPAPDTHAATADARFPPEAAHGATDVRVTAEEEHPSARQTGNEQKGEKKVFQAFNIKPLRQKLPTPAELDLLRSKGADPQEDDIIEVQDLQEAQCVCCDPSESGSEQKAQTAFGSDSKKVTTRCPSKPSDQNHNTPRSHPTHPACPPSAKQTSATNEQPITPAILTEAGGTSCLSLVTPTVTSADRESLATSEDSTASPKKVWRRVEEEDLSELQLRLLALQSASRKWHQKEQQVMKRSRDHMTKVTTRSASSVPAASERSRTRSKPAERTRTTRGGLRAADKGRACPKAAPRAPSDRRSLVSKKLVSPGSVRPALRKQQQQKQQKEQEEKRRQEEEERRKREEEIRRIRDLSNHEEQYNRFMKLVGGHKRTHSQSRDKEHRKSVGKACLDSLGNLYQYDNYEEVAMDTDSEAGSPVPSPTHSLLSSDEAGRLTHLPQLVLVSAPPPPPPPPPEELEPPPKPPFADEEEEEEMLLRETCLMSMANKRVEQPSLSAPSSPTPPSGDTPLPRGNLNTVSLNTHSQRSRFPRGLPAGRAAMVLPRHKSVVVSLKDSDSDSDVDSSSSQGVFGGLEFMIKEARRTAEASKPKAETGCEKENDPLRTAEVPPQQITREKSRTLKDVSSGPAAESVMDLKPNPEREAEQRLLKYRQLLQRDEVVLKHLLHQELKKGESLRMAESKVSKLKEQLQASEKIAMANRTLLRKLQEQVRRVEQRVSLKKSVLVRLEQAAGRDTKPQAAVRAPQRGSASSRANPHLAELMAQKRRLQQLESEYALKIQQLKETQALRTRGVPPPPPPVAEPPRMPAFSTRAETVPPTLPQPSLHDLSQDKLTLGTEDIPELEDTEPRPIRRSSIREDTVTKPLLDTASCLPSTEDRSKGGGAEPGEPTAEQVGELDVDVLRQRLSQQEGLGPLLQAELHRLGPDRDTPPAGQMLRLPVKTSVGQSGCLEQKPVPLQPYHSPLLVFKSYRFSPYYRTKEKLSLSSVSFSNTVDVHRRFCRFDLTGTCNHSGCPWQHMRDVTLRGVQLSEDLLSYSPSLLSCSSDEDVRTTTESYMKLLFGLNSDRMNLDQKAVLLVSKVNESRCHTPPFTTWKDRRKWRPRPSQRDIVLKDDSGDEMMDRQGSAGKTGDVPASRPSSSDVCVTFEDRRYYPSETDDVSNLELSVQEHPQDISLRIKLAFKILDQGRSVDEALSVLARSLEISSCNGELWIHYLTLLSLRGSKAELKEMCEAAVRRAPLHGVWWKYLTLETSFEGRDHVSQRLLHFLCEKALSGATEELSFQLMEVVLFRVELHLFTGRRKEGSHIMEAFLRSSSPRGDSSLLRASHRALLWLSYIHLCEFGHLPAVLFDPAQSGPTRLVSSEHFLLPWSTPQEVRQPADVLLALFEDALCHCAEDGMSAAERTRVCLPLHTNLLLLHKLQYRYEEAVSVCKPLLQLCPDVCVLRDGVCELLLLQEHTEQALRLWLLAMAECPHNAEVFYRCCCFLMEQDKVSAVTPLLRGFVLSLCEDEQSKRTPVDVLRHILGFATDELLQVPQIKEDLQEPIREQNTYLHLIHCRWQWMQGCVDAAVEAYERALGAVVKLEELHLLWMDYLQFAVSQPALRHRKLSELIYRCLSTVPTRLQLPFNPAQFWTCYRFHNKVVSFYLSRLPQPQHALLLEKLHCAMPNNTDLGLRILHADWLEGNLEHLRFHARLLSTSAPCCLPLWKILIAVQIELKESVEVRLCYQQALQHLPLSADLRKHRLLFEVAAGGASESLQRLVGACRQMGVAVDLVGVGLKANCK